MGISDILKNEHEFREWQKKNRLFGKRISILGDSISTFEGYNPDGYNVFYNAEKQRQAGIRQVSDTWWQTVIHFFGAELLVNNSWSGSRVTKLPGKDELFPSACSSERTSTLHIGIKNPDVILVYLGTNDWAFGAKIGNDTWQLNEDKHDFFEQAYAIMLQKLKENYPQAEIWCCTLSATYMSANPGFVFPAAYAGMHIEVYNEIIRQITFRNKCNLIDLYGYRRAYDSLDGTHPNYDGMHMIAMEVIRSMAGNEVSAFLNCPDNAPTVASIRRNHIIDSLIGKKVGDRYTVFRFLGWGGFFKTYLAADETCNKQWAMKLCDKHQQGFSPEFRNIILQESQTMMRFDHPAIPKVVDILENNDCICIIREYVDGETLAEVLRNRGPVTQDSAIRWAKQLCDVLGYLHKHNPPCIYQDVKPANVVLQPDGNVKLIDFGTATPYDDRAYNASVLGTIGYAAPEQYVGKWDCRSDIYGLGVTLHHLVTGVDPGMPPYETKPIRMLNPDLSPGLEAIILRCIQPNPDERFQTCDALMTALHKEQQHLSKESWRTKLFHRKYFK